MNSCSAQTGRKKERRAAILFFLAFSLSSTVHAGCNVVRSPDGKEQAIHIEYQFPAQISVPRNLPVGAVIARAQIVTFRRTGQSMFCDGGSSVLSAGSGASDAMIEQSYGHLLTNGARNGVAYRVLKSNGDGVDLNAFKTFTAPPNGIYWGFSEAIARDDFNQLVLVKTSDPIKAGTFFSAGEKLLLKVTADSGDRRPFTMATLRSTRQTTIIPQTCQLSAPSAVSLGAHPHGIFDRVGSTSRATSFHVSVFCEGVASKVYMTLSDPVDVGNTSDRLSLARDATASGIAVQILRNGHVLGLGPDSNAPGTINQFKLFDASAANPTHVQKFEARYIQTAQKVTAGSANSQVTIAMSYQ